MTSATSNVTTRLTPSTARWLRLVRSVGWCARRPANWCRSANNSALADLPQDLRRVLAEPGRWALRGHRGSVDHDRRAHSGDRSARSRVALELQQHAAMLDLRIGKDLRQGVDRPSRNLHRLELVQKIVALHARGRGAQLRDQLIAAREPILVGEVGRVVGEL